MSACRRIVWVVVSTSVLACALMAIAPVRARVIKLVRGGATVAERLHTYGSAAHSRLKPAFIEAQLAYPPLKVTLVGFKREKRLELWASAAGVAGAPMKLVKSYPILAASGESGPKLREGDRQVPEGVYKVSSLNPNSLYHLALRVDYPNDDDRRHAQAEGRTNLGGDIMIHGSNASVGCLAMGDEAIEELFVIAAEVGIQNMEVILCPFDLRVVEPVDDRAWVRARYRSIKDRLATLGAGQ